MIKNLTFTRLTSDHDIKPFDCDNKDLNDFFLSDSKNYLNTLLAVTYVFEVPDRTVAFYSVLNDKISLKDLPTKSQWKKVVKEIPFPKRTYPAHPAVKLARLAVDKNYRGKGLGTLILKHVKASFINNNKTGCRFITVDAYNNKNVIKFYEKNGFKFLSNEDLNDETRLLYYDLYNSKL